MTDDSLHMDHALAGEFQGHAETIHKLKQSDAHFARLLERNRALWEQIQAIHNDITPADDTTRVKLEKERLALLDDIGARIRAAEA